MSDTVAQAIARYAPTRRVAEAMGLGALLEGGTLGRGPFNEGDPQLGGSFGPFQILLEAHPGVTAQNASNPDYAVRYMLHSYESAARQVPDTLWHSNPELAAETTARLAERPAKDYYSTEDVHAKWAALQKHGLPGLKREPVGKVALSSAGSGFMSGLTGGSSSTPIALIVAVILVVVIIAKR